MECLLDPGQKANSLSQTCMLVYALSFHNHYFDGLPLQLDVRIPRHRDETGSRQRALYKSGAGCCRWILAASNTHSKLIVLRHFSLTVFLKAFLFPICI